MGFFFYRASQFQQGTCHLCAVGVNAVRLLLVDHGGGGGGGVAPLLAELLQCIGPLVGQRLQELFHAVLGDTAGFLPHQLLKGAGAVQSVVHHCSASSPTKQLQSSIKRM